MKTFYINTVTLHTTIALFEGNQVVAEKRWKSELNEADTLNPEVDALLKSQHLQNEDIQRLVVCVGPGGFTSSRVGVSAVNAWSFVKNTPVATVSVFDLYDEKEMVIVLSTNSQEAWVRFPGKDPQFISREQFKSDSSFIFGGILQPEWKKHLEDLGGTYKKVEEQLPDIRPLEFRQEIVKPWYYKDANITWSSRVHGKNS
jgi:tRNA threonylcarbamoyl adenosine modification protein YeaZ